MKKVFLVAVLMFVAVTFNSCSNTTDEIIENEEQTLGHDELGDHNHENDNLDIELALSGL